MNAVVGTILGLNVNGALVSMGAFNWDYYWLSRFVSDLALEQSDDDFILTWVNNGTVDWDYILIERKISGGDYAQIAQITNTLETYTDENFTVEGTYYYRVRLIKGTYYSSYCTAVSIAVSLAPDGSPINLIATVDSDTAITLNWTIGSTNHDGHRIYISTDGVTFSANSTVLGAVATKQVTGLTADTEYWFYVTAYKGGQESPASTAVSAETLPIPILELDFVERAMSQFVYNILDGTTRNNYIGNSSLLNQNIYGSSLISLVAGDVVQGATDPDGGATAWTITASAANSVKEWNVYNLTIGQTYTFSFWGRAAVNTAITIGWNDGGWVADNITLTPVWQLFSKSRVIAATNPAAWIGGGGTFAIGEVIEIWHPMVNAGNTVLAYNETPNKDWFRGTYIYPEAIDPPWTANGMSFDADNKMIRKIDPVNITGTANFTICMMLKLGNTAVQGGQLMTFNGSSTADMINIARIGKVTYVNPAGVDTILGDDAELVLDANYFTVQFIQDDTTAYLRIRKSPKLRTLTGVSEGMRSTLITGYVPTPNVPEVTYFTVWGKAIKESQGDAVYNYVNSKKPGILVSQSTLIVCDGDSNTDTMSGLTTIFTVYPGLLSIAYAGKAEVINVGIGGKKAIDLITDEPTTIDPFFVGNWTNKIMTVMVGINHAGEDSTTVYGHIRTLCLARKAVGWKVVVCTFTPITVQGSYPVWQETYRQEVNALIRANYTEFADALADVGGDSTIGDFGDQENLTYYSPDEVHLTAAGHVIVKDIVKAAIDSIVTV